MPITLRPPTVDDIAECGRIAFEAFGGIARAHSFPLDFDSAERSTSMMSMLIGHPAVFGVVAQSDGRLVGSNFLDERDVIRAVGPITVDPAFQSKGVGRKLMEAVIARARGAAGIRLVQDAFNTTSMPLYASLGFEVKEPLVLMTGKPTSAGPRSDVTRPMTASDVDECAALCRAVHGFDRRNELRDALGHLHPYVCHRNGRITAYCSAPTFWFMNHAVGETEQDIRDLLLGASGGNTQPIAFLLPTRQASLFRWLIGEGLRVVKPMTLMAMGSYQEPKGSFIPSVGY